MKKIILFLVIISAFHQVSHAQGRPNLSCFTQSQAAALNKEVSELSQAFQARSMEISRDLAEAIKKSMGASEAYRKCTAEISFADSLLGQDCSREKYIMEMMARQVENQTAVSESSNMMAQAKLQSIMSKYPKCQ
ncbi:MAG: hypothetical protein K2Q19_05125 [Rhodocyclaceae bacterium]|jgi:replication initiation and membrane attachment protein DnaB|nr:hypothetical protein [Rhodocyclaceae bacterium]